VQAKLEDVLKEKERELKLHQRFLDLKNYCEASIFPLVDLPLKDHVESLKRLIEGIIPDPKDRTQEMFSGEIFALLGTIYLHDIGLVKNYKWDAYDEIFNNLDIPDRKLFLNLGIGRKLDIPEMAIEIINHLTFSDIVKKIPVEWEISEESRRAIIRNTKVIGYIFNFSHLLHDIFCSDFRFQRLRRFHVPRLVLRSSDASVDIDSREGIIRIGYKARFPYELHELERARNSVEDMFNLFKNNVNGRLGFQYKELVWDVTTDFNYDRDIFQLPRFSPYDEFQTPPFNRQEEASHILDRVFTFRYAVVVGEATTGKTTLLKSFIIPQVVSLAPSVFYCELWGSPVNEIRDVICKRHKVYSFSGLDIISICKRLLENGPCIFVIDACERLMGLESRERETFGRFLDFCLGEENVYLIIAGDKETFFEWYGPFQKMNMSAIFEVKPVDRQAAADAFGEEKMQPDVRQYRKPIELELIQANLNMDKVLEDILKDVKENRELREIVAFIVNRTEAHLRRHTLENIYFETSVPRERILDHLALLKEKDIVQETDFLDETYYSLSSRYLKEPLYNVLGLSTFEEKKRVRTILQNAIVNETFLDDGGLDMVEIWDNEMIFSKEARGWILGSLIFQARDWAPFFEKARHDSNGIDIQPILRLLYVDDPDRRAAAVKLLVEIQDKNMINPLLLHLRNEDVLEIKDLLIKGISLTGKKRAIGAIMNTLKEIGDRQLRLRAIEFFYSLFGGNARRLLLEIKEKEDDEVILSNIESLLSKLEEIS
jgi:hypothetical protein